ncbi:MAG: hypothetical protein ACLPN5_23140 [Roseiarcus sp.]
MTSYVQLDLFGDNPPERPSAEAKPRAPQVDPDKVRGELLAVLAKVRAAKTIPWDARREQYWRVVFPQMTNWLPDDEAQRLRAEFAAEMQRLDAA